MSPFKLGFFIFSKTRRKVEYFPLSVLMKTPIVTQLWFVLSQDEPDNGKSRNNTRLKAAQTMRADENI